jgi:putrescine importer
VAQRRGGERPPAGGEVVWQTVDDAYRLRGGSLGFIGTLTPGVAASAAGTAFAGSLAVVAASAGMATPLALLLSTILMVMCGVSFGELNRSFPSAGGFYAYLRETTNVYFGWWVIWVFYLCAPIGVSVVGGICVSYVHEAWGLPYWLLAPAFSAVVLAINWRGIELATRIQGVIWIVQVLGILVIGALVFRWAATHDAHFGTALATAWDPRLSGIGLAGVLGGTMAGVFCFVGFETPTTLGEESRASSRTVYAAVSLAPLVTGIVLVLAGALWMPAVSPALLPDVQSSAAPLNVILEAASLQPLAPVITLVVVLSTFGCMAGFFNSMSRIFYDKARAGSLPKALGKLNRHRNPSNGNLLVAAITVIGILLQMYAGLFADFIWFVAVGATVLYGVISLANIIHYRHSWSLRGVLVNKLMPMVTLGVMIYLFATGVPRHILIVLLAWGALGVLVILAIRARKGRAAFELDYRVVGEVADDIEQGPGAGGTPPAPDSLVVGSGAARDGAGAASDPSG